MTLSLAGYQEKAAVAVGSFWEAREDARMRQAQRGGADQGERAGVTAGKNMNGFLDLARDVIVGNGLDESDICIQQRVLTLPGYFRPTKLWDMLIVRQGRLVGVLEFKSQVGPSFGNNFNNRSEEAIGSALDFLTAYREGAFGDVPRPFVGWLMLVEDCEKSRAPIWDKEPHFSVFADFKGASYLDRYNILCRKLVQEQLYSAAAVIATPRGGSDGGGYSELSELTGLKTFVTTLAGHIAAEAAR